LKVSKNIIVLEKIEIFERLYIRKWSKKIKRKKN